MTTTDRETSGGDEDHVQREADCMFGLAPQLQAQRKRKKRKKKQRETH